LKNTVLIACPVLAICYWAVDKWRTPLARIINSIVPVIFLVESKLSDKKIEKVPKRTKHKEKRKQHYLFLKRKRDINQKAGPMAVTRFTTGNPDAAPYLVSASSADD
jgi:hypothetical protein